MDITTVTLNHYITLSVLLFCLGTLGVLVRRNALLIFMSIELMMNAVNLMLVAFSHYKADLSGQVMVLFIYAVAAGEVAIGLAILIALFRHIKNVDINNFNIMKG